MELTRRDALAALAASGITIGGGIAALRWDDIHHHSASKVSFQQDEIETLTAIANVIYPSSVTGIPQFVETYVIGRIVDRPQYVQGLKQSLTTLNDYARDSFDARYTALSPEKQKKLLDLRSLDIREPDPTGMTTERIRYYLLNELLYALYTSPTGGKLVGLENPRGHPGGLTSYQRGPQREG